MFMRKELLLLSLIFSIGCLGPASVEESPLDCSGGFDGCVYSDGLFRLEFPIATPVSYENEGYNLSLCDSSAQECYDFKKHGSKPLSELVKESEAKNGNKDWFEEEVIGGLTVHSYDEFDDAWYSVMIVFLECGNETATLEYHTLNEIQFSVIKSNIRDQVGCG